MSRLERALLVVVGLLYGVGFLVGAHAAEPDEGEVVFSFTDGDIVESSGLVAREGLVVTVNDSGDGNRIFTVDPATGDTVGVTSWQGDPQDIEALAPADEGEVLVGDIGDNGGSRQSVELARVPFGRGERDVVAATYELAYPDGAHDAESLLVHPTTGRVYVVAKEFIGRLYAAPEQLAESGRNQLQLVDEVLGIATDAAFFPDGKHLVVRNYVQAAVYSWPALERIATVELPAQQQGEGIAVTDDGELLVSTEGAHTAVLRVELPAAVAADLAGTSSADPSPGASTTAPGEQPAGPPTETVPVEESGDRGWWPWGIGAVVGVVIVVVLLRSLRPR